MYQIGSKKNFNSIIGYLIFYSTIANAGLFPSLSSVTNVVINTVTNPISAISNTVPSGTSLQGYIINSSLNLITGCQNSSVDAIVTQCMSGSDQAQLNAAIGILKSRNYYVVRGGKIHSYNFFKQHTWFLINWDSATVKYTFLWGNIYDCSSDPNLYGCHTIDGATFLTTNGLSQDPVKLSGILVHEADHYNKSHTCGDSADADASGPYGLEAFYDMSVYRGTDGYVTSGQRSIAYSRASDIATYQLCGNGAAASQVYSYVNSSANLISSPTPSPATPPPTCKTCQIP